MMARTLLPPVRPETAPLRRCTCEPGNPNECGYCQARIDREQDAADMQTWATADRALVRDLAAMTAAGILVVITVAVAGPVITGAILLVAIPFLIIVTLLARSVRRAVNATDEWCSRVDQELDARQQLRVQRTVHAEPQAAVIDLFTREPVA